MPKTKILLVLGILFVLALLTVVFILNNKQTNASSIISPIPRILSTFVPKNVEDKSFWKPNITIVYATGAEKPVLSAASALSYDLSADKLLFSKNINERLPIASLTKIMTGVVGLENNNINKKITVSKYAATIGDNVMGLATGEQLTLEELLYGLILPSGNDAAEAIAEGTELGRENFIFLMNKKAEDLGLSDTRFTNSSGLEGDGNQYSSAYDLLVITKYALENETFRKVVSTVEYEIPQSASHKYFYLYNDTNLLTSYPGVKGVKVGYTDEAGLCLVTYLDYDGHKIIAVLLNSHNRRQEMKDLLDYSLRTLGVTPPPHQ